MIHLFFADDTLVLCDANLGQILFLRLVLFWFEVVPGLKINMGRSELVLVGVVPNITDMVGVSRLIPEPTQPTGADQTVPSLSPTD